MLRRSTLGGLATVAGLAGACVAGSGLAGCAVRHIERPNWARFGNTSTAEGGPAYHRDPHHQYFDRAHNRYYYYDPEQKQFFWENGQPKG